MKNVQKTKTFRKIILEKNDSELSREKILKLMEYVIEKKLTYTVYNSDVYLLVSEVQEKIQELGLNTKNTVSIDVFRDNVSGLQMYEFHFGVIGSMDKRGYESKYYKDSLKSAI